MPPLITSFVYALLENRTLLNGAEPADGAFMDPEWLEPEEQEERALSSFAAVAPTDALDKISDEGSQNSSNEREFHTMLGDWKRFQESLQYGKGALLNAQHWDEHQFLLALGKFIDKNPDVDFRIKKLHNYWHTSFQKEATSGWGLVETFIEAPVSAIKNGLITGNIQGVSELLFRTMSALALHEIFPYAIAKRMGWLDVGNALVAIAGSACSLYDAQSKLQEAATLRAPLEELAFDQQSIQKSFAQVARYNVEEADIAAAERLAAVFTEQSENELSALSINAFRAQQIETQANAQWNYAVWGLVDFSMYATAAGLDIYLKKPAGYGEVKATLQEEKQWMDLTLSAMLERLAKIFKVTSEVQKTLAVTESVSYLAFTGSRLMDQDSLVTERAAMLQRGTDWTQTYYKEYPGTARISASFALHQNGLSDTLDGWIYTGRIAATALSLVGLGQRILHRSFIDSSHITQALTYTLLGADLIWSAKTLWNGYTSYAEHSEAAKAHHTLKLELVEGTPRMENLQSAFLGVIQTDPVFAAQALLAKLHSPTQYSGAVDFLRSMEMPQPAITALTNTLAGNPHSLDYLLEFFKINVN